MTDRDIKILITTTKSIVDGRYIKTGDMKCCNCKEEIKDDYYLLIDYNADARGNEDDFSEIFCKKCSNKDGAWWSWDRKRRREIKDSIINLRADKRRAIELIRKATSINIDLDNNSITFESEFND